MVKVLKLKANINEKNIVFVFGVSLVTLFIMYGYLVNSTIVNIVERKVAERDTGDLIAVITDLEVENGELRKHITYEYAYSIGYVEPKDKTFTAARVLVGNIPAGF